MNILAIDTSTYVMGVALLKEGVPVGEIVTHEKKNHSVRLMAGIRSLFNEVDLEPKDLDRIVVSEGPGSYTGVRIGVTTAKTMAWGLGIPVVGVSSMEQLAQNGRHFPGLISPFFDARRGQVFTGLYEDQHGTVRELKENRMAIHTNWIEALKEFSQPILFLSPDMEKHEQLIQDELGELAVIGSPMECLPRPTELALIGMQKPVQGDTHTFSPNYLRLAEAEAKWLEANGKRKENG
ncbi:tRNA (adenosine(37)-N6)-threonylcarbamoyltransferase complex dimerization subunit type 1 TsaB [Salipaludibacillus keqinensis]|uniref:tRNA (Adenosine(37)-N6)-threonylcarbamoyltransferase complex dimerization subunit type 1 TsaB n=1 Tax=Salipaludibacillus keqinensis TaxID=2045207 RepID=A0A323TD64_9BACI|nr:tRNA (adenosine(37)-N6)-threonylcarbamoyltransferase complex dimerization subunit type 1 TsaB [Salipaludibacillus keqinensis]PYZ92154.1 tRNA (adenosine(37)-N6)-threonylcarbamoyltransferase complex dimerization subunit type 1 TsaB [Salipaludibacillus keqinensis]